MVVIFCLSMYNIVEKGVFYMNMIPVTSSNIKSIGYESNTLYVEFLNNSLYSYSGVPEYIYKNLMIADSHGHYLAVNIKGKYPYRKIR